MSVLVEQLAVRMFREFMLWHLPAKVAAVNATRFASLKASTPGPYTITAGQTLGIAPTYASTTFTNIALTTGSRTTAQLVSQINAAMSATIASADEQDRLVLTSTHAPDATPSKLWLRPNVATDANATFGWDPGGEKAQTTQLVAPGLKGVRNGLPLVPDFGPSGVVAVIVGNRSSVPLARRAMKHQVTLDVDVVRAEGTQNNDTREGIESAVRCVRELILTDAGGQLGDAPVNGETRIQLAEFGPVTVSGAPHQFRNKEQKALSNPYFEGAAMQLKVLVFERPATT